MPPKKRKSIAEQTTNTSTKRKAAPELDMDTSLASGRARRTSSVVSYEEPRRKRNKTSATAESAGKKAATAVAQDSTPVKRSRERPKTAKVEAQEDAEEKQEWVVAEAVKKRGRPAKNATKAKNEITVSEDFDDADMEEDEGEVAPEQAKKRGRPTKNASETKKEITVTEDFDDADEVEDEDEDEEIIEQEPPAKKRGRPAKAKAEPEPIIGKKRGRPAKKTEEVEETPAEEAEPPAKRRGRPAQSTAPETAPKQSDEAVTAPAGKKRGRPARAAAAQPEEDEDQTVEAEAPASGRRGRPAKISRPTPVEAPKKRGRPAKSATSAITKSSGTPVKRKAGTMTEPVPEDEVDTSNKVNPTEATTKIADSQETGTQYWLMKAEPESRIEKSYSGKDVDVKFSIDDLEAKTEPEPWEGIRNVVAQKNMRNMKKGDLAFLYESNCKPPGIVGVMEIVQEASVDEAAFDEDSAYFDPKSSRDKPKWQLVHVTLNRRLPRKISLRELQSHKSGRLQELQVLNQMRLSVSKVSPAEWHFILSLVADDEGDDEAVNGASCPAAAAEDPVQTSDFATAFEAPTTFSTFNSAADHVGELLEEAVDTAAEAAADFFGPEIKDVTNESVKSAELHDAEPTVTSPSMTEAALPSTEIEIEATQTPAAESRAEQDTSLLGTIKSAVGLENTTKTPSARPSSRSGSVKPSSRASPAKPRSRAGSAVPSTQNAATPLAGKRARSKSRTPGPAGRVSVFSSAMVGDAIAEGDEGEVDASAAVKDFLGEENVNGHTEGSSVFDPEGVEIGEALARPLSYA